MEKWSKPVLKEYSTKELANKVKARASSGGNDGIYEYEPIALKCQIEVCWYITNCDVLPIL